MKSRPGGAVAGVALCTAALVLSACGGGSTAATTSAPPTMSTTHTPAAEVLDAYRAMWADLVTAAETSDYQSALLPQHATGAALTLFTQGLARDQLHDIVTRGVTVHHPEVGSLSPTAAPDRATVTDCFDDSRWIEYTTGGAKAKNAPGGKKATTAELEKVSGVWKVSQITIGAAGTC